MEDCCLKELYSLPASFPEGFVPLYALIDNHRTKRRPVYIKFQAGWKSGKIDEEITKVVRARKYAGTTRNHNYSPTKASEEYLDYEFSFSLSLSSSTINYSLPRITTSYNYVYIRAVYVGITINPYFRLYNSIINNKWERWNKNATGERYNVIGHPCQEDYNPYEDSENIELIRQLIEKQIIQLVPEKKDYKPKDMVRVEIPSLKPQVMAALFLSH